MTQQIPQCLGSNLLDEGKPPSERPAADQIKTSQWTTLIRLSVDQLQCPISAGSIDLVWVVGRLRARVALSWDCTYFWSITVGLYFKNYVGRSLVFSPCKELNGAGIPHGNHLIIGMVVNREQREREQYCLLVCWRIISLFSPLSCQRTKPPPGTRCRYEEHLFTPILFIQRWLAVCLSVYNSV